GPCKGCDGSHIADHQLPTILIGVVTGHTLRDILTVAPMIMGNHCISSLHQVLSKFCVAGAMLRHAVSDFNHPFYIKMVRMPETNKDKMPVFCRQADLIGTHWRDLLISRHKSLGVRRLSVGFYALTNPAYCEKRRLFR